jgi:hypothetical protein
MQRYGVYIEDTVPNRDLDFSIKTGRGGNLFTVFKILRDKQEEMEAGPEETGLSILITKSKEKQLEYSVLKNSEIKPNNVILKISPSEELYEILEELSFNTNILNFVNIDSIVEDLVNIIKENPQNIINLEDDLEDTELKKVLTEIIVSTIKAEAVNLIRSLFEDFKNIIDSFENSEDDFIVLENAVKRLKFFKGEVEDLNFDTGIDSVNLYLKKFLNKLYLELDKNKKFKEKLGSYYKYKISKGDFYNADYFISDFNIDIDLNSNEIQKIILDSILNNELNTEDLDLLILRIENLNSTTPEIETYVYNLIDTLRYQKDFNSIVKLYYSESIQKLLNNSNLNLTILKEVLEFNIADLRSSDIIFLINKIKKFQPDFEFISLNKDFEILNNIKTALLNYNFIEAVSLKNLTSEKELPQEIKNLSLEIIRMSLKDDPGIVTPRFLYENGFLPNEELTEYEIQALTGNYPPETLISKVYAYDISYSEKINDISELPRFIEAPLLEAVTILWSKGIKTLGSTANKKDVGHFATLDIDLKSLSDENKKILDSLIATNKFLLEFSDVRESFSLKIKILEDSNISDVSKVANEFASYFKKQ